MKKLIAGNWKMNGSLEQGRGLVSDIARGLRQMPSLQEAADFLICPPASYLFAIEPACSEQGVSLGGQDCSVYERGAYTGDIAANMIRDCGGSYVILGHSERRQYHGEGSMLVADKVKCAREAGLIPIICVGETNEERQSGRENDVIGQQLLESLPEDVGAADDVVVAYEPVWAIGTGKTASVDDVSKMHSFVRQQLSERFSDFEKVRILYGGSMKPDNARDLLSAPNVNGGLIGGASLSAEQFLAIGLAALEN